MTMPPPQASHASGDRSCARALCGWSPPPLPADTPTKQRLDLLLAPIGTWCAVIVAVSAMFNLAAHLATREALAVDAVAALLAGAICSANFWRCRHAHCLITGGGWLLLSAVALVGAGIGHSVIGGREQTAFLAILAIAVLFEVTWYLARGTNAIALARRGTPAHRSRTQR